MRILLAIDGSKFSEAAVRAVLGRPYPKATKIQVLHVIQPPPLLVSRAMGGYDTILDAVWNAETKQAKALVTRVAGQLRSRGLQVTAAVEQGDPKSKIIDVASQWRADWIVLGSHGRGGLDRFLLGSVSDAVSRHAPCSVEIVRIRSRRAKPR